VYIIFKLGTQYDYGHQQEIIKSLNKK